MKPLTVLALQYKPTGRLLGTPSLTIVGGGSNVFQLGQSVSLQCSVQSTVPETIRVNWSTTALSANISDQEANTFGDFVIELLHLTNLDSGYCGEYTCTITDSDMMPGSASTSISIGE